MKRKLSLGVRMALKKYLKMSNEEIIASAKIAFKGLKRKTKNPIEKFDAAMEMFEKK